MENNSNQNYEYDSLTGLRNYSSFKGIVQNIIDSDDEGIISGKYAFVYFDVLRFKTINDIFTVEEGDKFLTYMAGKIDEMGGDDGVSCRINSDRFALFTKKSGSVLENALDEYLQAIAAYHLPYEIISNIGIYVTRRSGMAVDSMLSRAILAHSAIKGSYINKYNYYDRSQRDAILGEQEITGMMNSALEEKQFVPYYQPQYSHNDGSIVGAEALVRWVHPKRGIISPGKFVPIFEKNGFITKIDIYMFEQVCVFIRETLDREQPIVPISVNISRRDIFQTDLAETLESIRVKHNVPVDLIRIEVTESAIADVTSHFKDFIDKMHGYGYIIEMDDFGSAYSSLNALKNIDIDILKLDMKFLSDEGDNKRGGIILSSVIRMAKWLGFPVIVEGVEQPEQADYVLSVGCSYIQGYLYSKPVPQSEFTKMLNESEHSAIVPPMKLLEPMNAGNFWDPGSLDTIIFSNYVGAAAIFEYKKSGGFEILRVNKKYAKEIDPNFSPEDVINMNLGDMLDDENKIIFHKMVKRAISSQSDEKCETWRTVGNGKRVCIRSSVRLIGKSSDSYLFYSIIRNVTAEKTAKQEIIRREKMFIAASEQLNIYYWEYNLVTKELIPSYRCIRDLGLPKVIRDYPESAIKMGFCSPEDADLFRNIHKRVENGERNIQVDIPLTPKHIMCTVRYTTEFDKDGKPVKAYGSAVPI